VTEDGDTAQVAFTNGLLRGVRVLMYCLAATLLAGAVAMLGVCVFLGVQIGVFASAPLVLLAALLILVAVALVRGAIAAARGARQFGDGVLRIGPTGLSVALGSQEPVVTPWERIDGVETTGSGVRAKLVIHIAPDPAPTAAGGGRRRSFVRPFTIRLSDPRTDPVGVLQMLAAYAPGRVVIPNDGGLDRPSTT
jgi:hypothetical protein